MLLKVCSRTSRWLVAHRWLLAVSNIVAAASFVVGCIGFYWPSLYTGSVTAFLFGSVVFLFTAAATALLESPHFDR
jgi:hypothetical protein